MFTGIIKDISTIHAMVRQGRNLRYSVISPICAQKAELGASIAIDGVCQTVSDIQKDGTLSFDAIEETLHKTTLGALQRGQRVHLEPALRMGDAIDGHLVYGHVDGQAKIHHIYHQQGRFDLSIQLNDGYERYCIKGGSIAIHGVSLTIFKVEAKVVSVSLIPETLDRTIFSSLKVGDDVNIEVDAMARYIEKLQGAGAKSNSDLENKLGQWGY